MNNLVELYELVMDIKASWESNEAADWSEAEQLLFNFKKLPEQQLNNMPRVKSAIAYARANKDWGSEIVIGWPVVFLESLEEVMSDDDLSRVRTQMIANSVLNLQSHELNTLEQTKKIQIYVSRSVEQFFCDEIKVPASTCPAKMHEITNAISDSDHLVFEEENYSDGNYFTQWREVSSHD